MRPRCKPRLSLPVQGGCLSLLPQAAQKSSHHFCNQPQGFCDLCLLLGDFYLLRFSYFFHVDTLHQAGMCCTTTALKGAGAFAVIFPLVFGKLLQNLTTSAMLEVTLLLGSTLVT